jgi:hypothetical protein
MSEAAKPGRLKLDRSGPPFLDVIETANSRHPRVDIEEAPVLPAPSDLMLCAVPHLCYANLAIVKMRECAVCSHCSS